MNGAGTAPHVLIYRITGRQGAIRVPRWVCPECDLTVAAVRMALTQAGLDGATVEVRPWLTHLGQALRDGARHPPAVLVDGLLVCQGRVPDVDMLVRHLREAAACSG